MSIYLCGCKDTRCQEEVRIRGLRKKGVFPIVDYCRRGPEPTDQLVKTDLLDEDGVEYSLYIET